MSHIRSNRWCCSYFCYLYLICYTILRSKSDEFHMNFYFSIFSQHGGFGMVLTHRRAALLSARRIELCDLVDRTLFYLHPDTRVHSFLSPLPYEVNDSILLFCFIAKLTGKISIYKIINSVLTQSFALVFRISDYLVDLFCFNRELCDTICQIC